MINKKPSPKVEKAWLSRVAEHGCVVTRQSNIQLHHCVGREGKQDKFHIGRWFVLPLEFELHDIRGKDPCNVTNHRHAFTSQYGSQMALFQKMCWDLEEEGPLPFKAEVMEAILATNR